MNDDVQLSLVETPQDTPKKIRFSNFDILKIIAIFMVVVLHYNNVGFGGALNTTNDSIYFIKAMESICVVAVPIFILITGYFSYKSTFFSLRKVIGLYIMECCYLLICFFLNILIFKQPFDGGWLTYCFSFTNYYINLYLFLMLLAPFVNKLFKLSKKIVITVLIIYAFFIFLYPTLWDISLAFTNPSMSFQSLYMFSYGYTIVAFLFYYLVGAAIHTYDFKLKKIWLFLIYFVSLGIIFGLSIFTDRMWQYDNFFVMINGVALFLIFKSIKIKESKVITKIAECSLGVFVLHTSDMFAHSYNGLFNIVDTCNRGFIYTLGNMALVVFSTVLLCMAADLLLRFITTPLRNLLYNSKWVNYKIIDLSENIV